jgi:hypothetical protein
MMEEELNDLVGPKGKHDECTATATGRRPAWSS